MRRLCQQLRPTTRLAGLAQAKGASPGATWEGQIEVGELRVCMRAPMAGPQHAGAAKYPYGRLLSSGSVIMFVVEGAMAMGESKAGVREKEGENVKSSSSLLSGPGSGVAGRQTAASAQQRQRLVHCWPAGAARLARAVPRSRHLLLGVDGRGGASARRGRAELRLRYGTVHVRQ